MRYFLLLVLLIPLIATASDEDKINDLLNGFHQAAASSDFEDYFSRFSSDAYFLGTDASERWSVEAFKTYAKPAFDNGSGWTYEVQKRNLQQQKRIKVFWFDEVLMNAELGLCRGTGVVVKEKGDWKIAHYSLTMLIPNTIAREVGKRSLRSDGGPVNL